MKPEMRKVNRSTGLGIGEKAPAATSKHVLKVKWVIPVVPLRPACQHLEGCMTGMKLAKRLLRDRHFRSTVRWMLYRDGRRKEKMMQIAPYVLWGLDFLLEPDIIYEIC